MWDSGTAGQWVSSPTESGTVGQLEHDSGTVGQSEHDSGTVGQRGSWVSWVSVSNLGDLGQRDSSCRGTVKTAGRLDWSGHDGGAIRR